jgi:hypothetical protein
MPAITREVVVAVQGLVVLFCGALALLPRPGLVALHAALQRGRASGPALHGRGAAVEKG